jgi:hypothetical protein
MLWDNNKVANITKSFISRKNCKWIINSDFLVMEGALPSPDGGRTGAGHLVIITLDHLERWRIEAAIAC